MKTLEWWYDLEPGFLAHTDVLQNSFPTRVAGRDAVVHPPGVPKGAMAWAGSVLGPPQFGYTAQSPPDAQWGWLDSFTAKNEEIVAIKRLVLTSPVDPDVEDVQQIAEHVVAATDTWWSAISAWVEIITGQHLTHVGHHKPDVVGNPTSIWLVAEDGFQSAPVTIPTVYRMQLSPLNLVDSAMLRSAALLADPGPPLAWTLLRDARSLKNVRQYRRAVIDSATAADVAVTQLLDDQLSIHNPQDRPKILKESRMLGSKLHQLSKVGTSLPQSFQDKLVDKRNVAVHEGASITDSECGDAIAEAASVVELAFPLPTPPGTDQQLHRLW
ncbi:hypothetical protein [Mycolicibacter sinensis]|uniref:Apea-like HEPN domain-containing protein n=1 Tax=Mycolicibacter sinensis (strain JDM601) TaxID=875328 RepID=A0A1A3U7E0_MYCSD|nr:hypothetical protein [Mycolicibacter sinensis]OBK90567.1 hypothetical protein A5648_16975 [Mycolicibacter sinensis]